jgi:DNA helicase-4
MSLPDGAEYWQDVKGHFNRSPVSMGCSKFTGCEYKGNYFTYDIEQVTCHWCKAHMTDEIKAEMAKRHQQQLDATANRIKLADEKLISVNGACPKCGNPLTIRKNGKTSEKFRGCIKYPQCKHTEPIK